MKLVNFMSMRVSNLNQTKLQYSQKSNSSVDLVFQAQDPYKTENNDFGFFFGRQFQTQNTTHFSKPNILEKWCIKLKWNA